MAIRVFDGVKPVIHGTAYVDPAAIVIGDVEIDEESFVLPYAVIRGDVNRVRIGPHTNVQDGTVIHVNSDTMVNLGGSSTIIGGQVTIGHKCVLHGCTIGDHCLIGMASTIMDGVVIERDVMLAAASLVTPGKHLESGFLYAGAPARQVRPLRDEEHEYIEWSYRHYSELKYKHRDAMRGSRESTVDQSVS